MTYCLELFSSMTKRNEDIEVVRANYTKDGLEAIIYDTFDNQHYKIVITPYIETKEKSNA